ncbi:MAG: hypothetical protein KAQ99_07275, partial [Candidatus Aureabacteria bacterium]|nr:hypothetical protein [Candidatus Auribacterota bacterium]
PAEAYNISEDMEINWTATGTVGDVRINYTSTGGAPYNYAVQNGTGGYYFDETDVYNWTVPADAQISENIRLYIYAASDEEVNSTSSNTMAIRGKLTLDAPNGTEVWKVGDLKYINWSRSGDSMGNIRLDYTTDNNTSDNFSNEICGSMSSASPSQYQWQIPNVMSGNPSTRYDEMKVKISLLGVENLTYDESDAVFYIVPSITVTRPSALTPVFYVDDNESVEWSSSGDLDYVNIWYSNDTGSSWQLCEGGEHQLNNGNFTWQVPNVIGDQTRVKVTSYYDNTTEEAGDDYGDFEIMPQIDMVYPVGGEEVIVDDTCGIQWDNHGTVGTVYLQWSNDSGANWYNISGADNLSNESYGWPVPDDIDTDTRVKIISEVYSSVTANSTDFKIRGDVNVTVPQDDANVNAHSANTAIRWTNVGSLTGNVTVEYYNGSAWNTIGNNVSVSDNDTYLWPQVPDITVDGSVQIRVTLEEDTNVTNTSDTFNIIGNVTVQAPAGSANWKPGTGGNVIQWLSYAVSQVHLKWSNDSG